MKTNSKKYQHYETGQLYEVISVNWSKRSPILS
jgi:hypothetical protein